jgi:hypothetical protein
MVMANTLAYYDVATITAVKSFVAQDLGAAFTTLHFLCNLRKGPIS